ncbi:HTTM domain-containing protein [Adhaeribacter aerolatus]|uniref:HTTM domain-containing protein n=1 Tax=Adhaeribacter aerolatus TaxID=670289 RepID=A0A512B1A8_9BACT|nr:HTTM domain-containing protein [Adhaeribacter aerolatus]GEO05739.1 HTTM domain-containing protein [Adhaeribacter aerolatus]
MHSLLLYFKKIFTVDLRALAFMRIWIAGIIITDLAIRATDLEAHYSNMGVLPLHVMFQHTWDPFYFSLHTLSGLWQVQAFLFLLAAGAAFCLLLGYKTRAATIISWVLLVSLQNRNTLISQGGDDLLRMLLFWAIFLPWGKYYSVDAIRSKKNAPRPAPYVSVATAAYILQVCFMYIFTAFIKTSPEWRTEGTALYYALSLDQVLMPMGHLIYPYPVLLKYLTHLTFYTELLLPLVLFIPVYTTFFRLVFVGVLASFHVGISLTLFVGLFYLINFASLAGMLPAKTMDWVDTKVLPLYSRIYLRLKEMHVRLRNPVPVSVEVKFIPPTWLTNSRRLVLREATVLFFLAYVLWWNLDVAVFKGNAMSPSNRWIGTFLRIDQYWGMFAPAVFKDDGWYILEGTTNQNRVVDLNQKGRVANYAKPPSVMALFKNDRWRKYSENYLFVHNSFMRPYYCNYMLRIWNENHPEEPVTNLEVIYMKEVTLPDYQVSPPTREVLCACALTP